MFPEFVLMASRFSSLGGFFYSGLFLVDLTCILLSSDYMYTTLRT